MMDVPTHRSRQFRLAALGIVLLTVAIRLPSLLHPQPIDSEAMYSVVANEIVDGGRPYADAVERKPPVLFWTYAAVFKVAGERSEEHTSELQLPLNISYAVFCLKKKKKKKNTKKRLTSHITYTHCKKKKYNIT